MNTVYQDYKRKIETLNNEIINLNTLISNNKLEELKKNSLDLERIINELNGKLLTLTREEEELNSKRQIISERSKYEASDVKVHENITNLKNRRLSLQSDLNVLEKTLEGMYTNLEISKKDIQTLVNTLSDMKNKKDNLNKEYAIKMREYQENTNRINIIKDNLENNMLVNSNVKKVLNNPRLSGIYDAFGNILNTDEMYSKALEVVIAGSKNFIITENEESAKEAINYLKNNNLGRATFFPISVIKPKGVDIDTQNSLNKEIDYLGTMASFVTYDDKYRDIVLNQLGNILVCKDIDSANHISKLINNRYKIVTLDGEVIHVGGSISGGSINVTASPISLKNELNTRVIQNNNLRSVVDSLEKSINEQNKKIISMEEEVYKKRGEHIRDEEVCFSQKDNFEKMQKELAGIDEELSNLSDLSKEHMQSEEEKVLEEYYAKHEEKELIYKELKDKNKEHDKIKADILALEGDLHVHNSELRSKEKELKDLEIAISRMDAKLDNDLEILNSDYEMTYEKASSEFTLDMEMDEARSLVNKYKLRLKNIGI